MPAAPSDPTDLENQLAFETLMSDVSTRLIAAPDQAFASTLEQALGETARFFGADCGQLLAVHGPQSEVRVLNTWCDDTVEPRWRERIASEQPAAATRATRMRSVNPCVIPRNHRVEEALAAASDAGDLAPFERLLAALRRPYDDTPQHAAYAEPAPPAVTACYRTFCGT